MMILGNVCGGSASCLLLVVSAFRMDADLSPADLPSVSCLLIGRALAMVAILGTNQPMKNLSVNIPLRQN